MYRCVFEYEEVYRVFEERARRGQVIVFTFTYALLMLYSCFTYDLLTYAAFTYALLMLSSFGEVTFVLVKQVN